MAHCYSMALVDSDGSQANWTQPDGRRALRRRTTVREPKQGWRHSFRVLMNSEHERLKHILAEAVSKATSAECAAYLDGACREYPELRSRVEALLDAHDRAGGFLEAPVVTLPQQTVVVSPPLTEKVGDRIGRYKLLQQIGEGGCGVVYMAEQEEPVRRRVALKVIKLGMDTKSVIARFEAERQALALMDHPNIAKVLDAGATETGRPFFVMELVRGIKITEYCDQNHLSTGGGWTCSSRSATRSSTRTRRASSTGTSSRRTSWSACTTACRCRW